MPYECPRGCGRTLYYCEEEGAECYHCGFPYNDDEE